MAEEIVEVKFSRTNAEKILQKYYEDHNVPDKRRLLESNLKDDVILKFARESTKEGKSSILMYDIGDYEWIPHRHDNYQKLLILNLDLHSINFPKRMKRYINNSRLTLKTLADLLYFNDKELTELKGVGPQTIYVMDEYLKKTYGVCIRKK